MKKTICELFAWVGWFRLWFERNNSWWETVWASQREPSTTAQHAYECYKAHFWDFKNMNVNISDVKTKDIPEHTLLVWWFPCQDYSVARTWAKWMQWKKWVLWWDIYRILGDKKAKFVLLENVDRLLKSPGNQRGRDFWVILACLNELWYSAEWRVINAAEYWELQRRRRTYIFAYKNNTKYWKSLKKTKFKDILHKDWFFVWKFPIKEELGKNWFKEDAFENYGTEITDISDKFKFEFQNAWIMRDGKIYTEDVIPDYSWKFRLLWDKDVLEKNVDDKYYIKQNLEKWDKLKDAKDIIRKEWTPQEYHFREWKIAFPDPLDRPARTMLTSEWTLNRSSHVVEDKKWKRILTPVECERINWFDDDWTNTWMPERTRYFCMWNALVVQLITKMWQRLDEIIEKED